jgi:alpha-1,3-glucosyltransferase
MDSIHNTRQYLVNNNIDIHFQYNLMMQAILILSIAMINRKRFLVGALLFSILLNFKHIYLYCAPAYAAYLIKEYVLAIKTKDISHK